MEKTKSVNVRFSEPERLEIERMARQLNVSMSDVIRTAFQIHNYDDNLIEQFENIHRRFNSDIGAIECNNVKISNNINQIARFYNSGNNVKNVERHFDLMVRSFNTQNELLESILIELEKLNKRR